MSHKPSYSNIDMKQKYERFCVMTPEEVIVQLKERN